MRLTVTALALGLTALRTLAITVDWTCSTDSNRWTDGGVVSVEPYDPHVSNDLMITPHTDQRIEGFGGCFNELGWNALGCLDKKSRAQVLEQLFGPENCNFTICRTPVGANDFATEWYSYDETDGDFDLRHFSIKRDKGCLIPYIKAALKVNPTLRIWASPWSPPQWMKTNRHYANKSADINGLPEHLQAPTGTDQFIQDDRYLSAYSRYLSRYVSDYARAGVKIWMLQFQNEPYTFNIWPNCSWTPEGMARFIGGYLGPEFAKNHPATELWLGTMNTDRKDHIDYILSDPAAGMYLRGVGFQWEGRDIIGDVHRANPAMPLIQTENECGSGTLDWGAAEHTFDLMKDYIEHGASIYTYFNMVLQDECVSSWGWKQNAMVVVDSANRSVNYTPEFYVMKHFSRFVAPGAFRLQTLGNNADTLAFRNPDGSVVVVIANRTDSDRDFNMAYLDNVISLKMQPHSFNTLVINE